MNSFNPIFNNYVCLLHITNYVYFWWNGRNAEMNAFCQKGHWNSKKTHRALWQKATWQKSLKANTLCEQYQPVPLIKSQECICRTWWCHSDLDLWSRNVICSFSGPKWTFVLNLMKLPLMTVLQRCRGDENVMDRWYDSSHRSCGQHRGIKHLYASLFMCISWRFDDRETAFRCSASSGHTLLIARVSIRDVFVCVKYLFPARSQPRWLNVSECHTYMNACSP